MIGIYGLSEEEFDSLNYPFSKEFYRIDYGAGNCNGKVFNIILSYKAIIPKEILRDLRAKVHPHHKIHFVREIKEEECL